MRSKNEMKKHTLEVCTFSLESCLNAQLAGADRVELCTAMYDGGTTPSAAQIALARELLDIELFVMIRPRGGDFLYTELEFRQMKEEIKFAKELGADGIVLGILKSDGRVDVERTRELVECASPLNVTFHRAFDMADQLEQALEDVIAAGCTRILTSGGKNTVNEGIDMLERLAVQANGRIRLMAGSGVNAGNALRLLEIGMDDLHLSGKSSRDSRMVYRNPDLFMGGVPGIPEYEQYYSDVEKLKSVVRLIK